LQGQSQILSPTGKVFASSYPIKEGLKVQTEIL